MKKITILLIIIPLILSGCWDQKIYEKIGFILALSAESSEKEGELLITFTSPVVGVEKKNTVEIIHTTAGILRAGRENSRRMSPRILEAGKLQSVIFSEELARKGGIHDIFEIIQRDPLDPALAWIVVVEGSPSELIEKASKFENRPRPAMYVNQLIEGNIRSSYTPETRAYDFDITYFAPGIDPMTPLLRLNPNDILVVGSALFSKDKMVGKIDHKQTSLILAMRNMMKFTEYITTIPQKFEEPEGINKHMAVMLKPGRRRLDVKIENNRPEVNISLKFTGTLDSYKWDDLGNQSVQEKIEEHLESQIKKECMETVKYMQEVGSDPIGIGDIVRAKHNSYWKSINWQDTYKEAVFNIDAEVEITQFGVIQ